MGVLGDDERRGAAGGIHFIARSDGIREALTSAAAGADFGRGVDVKFVGCFGKDGGADVTTFHDDVVVASIGALLFDEHPPHLGDGGDGGDVGIHFVGNEMRRGVEAVEENGGFAVGDAAFDFGEMKELVHAPGVGGRDAF